jgi:pyroglutamyl-peptidase
MTLRALITGFEPIWGIKRTPSGELAKLWKDEALSVENVEVRSLVLPQVFGQCTEMVCTEIDAWKPNIVLMYGATQHNDPLRLERFAINVERSAMGDNTRVPVKERPVIRGGPPAYESSLPIELLINNLNEVGVSSKASYHAGTHTCNSLLYGVMHWLANHPMPHPVTAGFLHVSFPNEFGVIEDELWSTANFQGIVRASVTLLEQLSHWYVSAHGQ